MEKILGGKRMKTQYKLASVALLGALGVGLAVASETKATSSATGAGKIEFTQKVPGLTSGDTMLPPDTTEPMIKPTTDIIPGTDKVQFEFISSLDFDTNDIVSTASDKSFDVKVYQAPKADGSGQFTMPHFVRFRDLRADAATKNNYNIKAKMSQDFTQTGGATLKGTLTYNNVRLTSSNNAPSLPESSNAANTLLTTFNLPSTGAEVTVLTQAQDGKGYGEHELMFGSYADVNGTANGKYTGVQLTVPGDTVIREGAYNAVITWTIEETA